MKTNSTPGQKTSFSKKQKRRFKRLPYDLMAGVPSTSYEAYEADMLPDVIPNLWDSPAKITIH